MPRCFAIIPAAGYSTRMGQPKLLMPWGERPLILHAIEAWQRSRVDRVLVVVRPGDETLEKIVRVTKAELVVPESPPPDMKASVQAALRQIAVSLEPSADDAFLVAPADIPRLSPAVINRLIGEHRTGDVSSILVPAITGRRGHPVLFPWTAAAEVHRLEPDQGLNAVVDRANPRLIPCQDLVTPDESAFADIDTPEDFRRLRGEV